MPWSPRSHRPRGAGRNKEQDKLSKQARDGAFYSHRRWRRYRQWFLSQPGNQLCAICLEHGLTVLGNTIDHIKPRRSHPELTFDPSNCRTLCPSCHSKHGSKA